MIDMRSKGRPLMIEDILGAKIMVHGAKIPA